MKKMFSLIAAACVIFSLTACGNGDNDATEQTTEPESSYTNSTSNSGSDGSSGSYSSSNHDNTSESIDPDNYSFEDYLKDNDPDSYEYYQDLEEGWSSYTLNSENGFFQ